MIYYPLLVLLRVLQFLPLSIRRIIGSVIGLIVILFARQEYKIAQLQLEKIFKDPNYKKIARNVFQYVAINIFESINLFPILRKADSKINVNDPELFQRVLSSKGSTIALTAHTGYWDLLAAYVVQRGGKLVTIGRPARIEALQKILSGLRESYGINTIWRNSLQSNRELLQLASTKVVIAALIDQDTKVKSIFSNFFGIPCKTPVSLVQLGINSNSFLLSAFLFKDKDSNYQIYIKEIKADSLQEAIDQYHQHLEELIRKYPDQWVWFHKRWRSNTDGSTMSSSEYENYLEQM